MDWPVDVVVSVAYFIQDIPTLHAWTIVHKHAYHTLKYQIMWQEHHVRSLLDHQNLHRSYMKQINPFLSAAIESRSMWTMDPWLRFDRNCEIHANAKTIMHILNRLFYPIPTQTGLGSMKRIRICSPRVVSFEIHM